jgi:hypothetical protein
MESTARRRSTEGVSTWLVVAVLAAALLGYAGWVTLAGTSPGRVPGSLSLTERLSLEGGQTRSYGPGRAPEGAVFACTNSGLRVVGRVPAAGKTLRRHLVPPQGSGSVTLRIDARADGSVRIRCGL